MRPLGLLDCADTGSLTVSSQAAFRVELIQLARQLDGRSDEAQCRLFDEWYDRVSPSFSHDVKYTVLAKHAGIAAVEINDVADARIKRALGRAVLKIDLDTAVEKVSRVHPSLP